MRSGRMRGVKRVRVVERERGGGNGKESREREGGRQREGREREGGIEREGWENRRRIWNYIITLQRKNVWWWIKKQKLNGCIVSYRKYDTSLWLNFILFMVKPLQVHNDTKVGWMWFHWHIKSLLQMRITSEVRINWCHIWRLISVPNTLVCDISDHRFALLLFIFGLVFKSWHLSKHQLPY